MNAAAYTDLVKGIKKNAKLFGRPLKNKRNKFSQDLVEKISLF
jgi:hypothetical protein